MINKKEVVPPKHKPPTDGPENKNRLKRKLQTVEAELAHIAANNYFEFRSGSYTILNDDYSLLKGILC